MKIEADLRSWKLPFRINDDPGWPCPTCRMGMLRIKRETFNSEELHDSRDHDHDAWEPDWVKLTFSCMLICENSSCKEFVGCTGIGSVSIEYVMGEDGSDDSFCEKYFSPKYFEPHLRLFPIPKTCPESVREILNESFRLFFSSPGAALNSVRMAIEQLLTELKVRRFSKEGQRRKFIPLHKRIDLLPSSYGHLKELIQAIKWLGNAGSHASDEIDQSDVLDSYSLFEHSLNQIYNSNHKRLQAIAKSVNRRRGPIRKKKRPLF